MESASSNDAAQSQYMGTYVCTKAMSATPRTNGSSFRVPPPAALFQIPPLQSSFPSLLNPHYDLVKEHCDEWIVDVAQPPSAAARRLLIECVLPRLICRAIPTSSSVPRLVHATKMIAWLTIADDEDDHPDANGADDATSAQHASRVLAILHCKEDAARNEPMQGSEYVLTDDAVCVLSKQSNGGSVSCKTSEKKEGALIEASCVPKQCNGDSVSCNKSERKEGALEALSKLWAEMRREMTPGLQERFVLTMENYFRAIKLQATFRKLHRLPDIEAYLEIRRQASFILPCFALLEYALGMNLEEEAYNHPLVERFRILALDFIFLCNDLISCKVEIGVGDYFNLPSIAYCTSSNKDWSFQDAINFVAGRIKDLDAQCVLMLPVIQQTSSPSVNTYIGALGSCMAGSLAWFLETARYRNSSSNVMDN